MLIDALKYRTEDKKDIIIQVNLVIGVGYTNNNIWRIEDIKYKTSRQRKYKYFSESFSNNYDYRRLDSKEREKYILSKYIEFVGEDKLKEALTAAHKSIIPNLDNLAVSYV